jgi:hypothetical protein
MKTLAMDSPIKNRTEVERAIVTCCEEEECTKYDRCQTQYLLTSWERKKKDSAYTHKPAGG